MVAQIIINLFTILMLVTGNVVRPEDLKPGDHIYTYRRYGLYTHHGIYVGEGIVIHFTRTGVEKTSLDFFRREGKKLHSLNLFAHERPLLEYRLTRWGNCMNLPDAKSPQEVVSKACELLESNGFDEYNLVNNNFEHFAWFCRTGVQVSAQTAWISACEWKIKEVKKWAMKFLLTSRD